MRFVRMDPPGTYCLYEALWRMLRGSAGRRFLDVGCGSGDLSLRLLQRGYSGVGVDFSVDALAAATQRSAPFIAASTYRLLECDVRRELPVAADFDLVLSLFVMEHLEDDLAFLERLSSRTRRGGQVLLAVPGRSDKWSLEDETVGHYRRYSRRELSALLAKAGLRGPQVWSVGVPLVNMLFSLGNWAIARSQEPGKRGLSREAQAKASGVRDIPFKTTFPPFCRLGLNGVAMWPFVQLQRCFQGTDLGLIILAGAQRP